MRNTTSENAAILFMMILVLLLPIVTQGRHITRNHRRAGATRWENKEEWHDAEKSRRVHGKADTVQVIAGSRLPDCSHACGSCSPCRLVMVSFVCASLQEAETCPMAYKCMCNSKSYPVP
ncbi:Protein EPIDERMAL PATTERNING FACTOR 1 [Ananas comosus]|uniref:Epidermal patterning factor-like protein n=2 Tax=Ananas comosus TaxID=4615 RepID=A0A199W859_ANACO|nr:Protein EPIDERMAL PATTERNING FACTOR 1 [Ananas comosus]CAD1819350.1 unnamed protein product [Ananas comosus var. bracteatus]